MPGPPASCEWILFRSSTGAINEASSQRYCVFSMSPRLFFGWKHNKALPCKQLLVWHTTHLSRYLRNKNAQLNSEESLKHSQSSGTSFCLYVKKLPVSIFEKRAARPVVEPATAAPYQYKSHGRNISAKSTIDFKSAIKLISHENFDHSIEGSSQKFAHRGQTKELSYGTLSPPPPPQTKVWSTRENVWQRYTSKIAFCDSQRHLRNIRKRSKVSNEYSQLRQK